MELHKVKEHRERRDMHVLADYPVQAEHQDSWKNHGAGNGDTHFHEKNGTYEVGKERPEIKIYSEKSWKESLAKKEYLKKLFRRAYPHYIEALEYAIQLHDEQGILQNHLQLAFCCYYLKMQSQALYHSQQVLERIKINKVWGRNLISEAYYVRLNIYYRQKDMNNFSRLLKMYLGFGEGKPQHRMEVELLELHLAVESAHISFNELENRITTIVSENSWIEALINHTEENQQRLTDTEMAQGILIAVLFYRLNKIDKAERLLKKVEENLRETEHIQYRNEVYTLLGELALTKKNTALAAEYFKKLADFN